MVVILLGTQGTACNPTVKSRLRRFRDGYFTAGTLFAILLVHQVVQETRAPTEAGRYGGNVRHEIAHYLEMN